MPRPRAARRPSPALAAALVGAALPHAALSSRVWRAAAPPGRSAEAVNSTEASEVATLSRYPVTPSRHPETPSRCRLADPAALSIPEDEIEIVFVRHGLSLNNVFKKDFLTNLAAFGMFFLSDSPDRNWQESSASKFISGYVRACKVHKLCGSYEPGAESSINWECDHSSQDCLLHPQGEESAADLARTLFDVLPADLPVEGFFASPLRRTLQTLFTAFGPMIARHPDSAVGVQPWAHEKYSGESDLAHDGNLVAEFLNQLERHLMPWLALNLEGRDVQDVGSSPLISVEEFLGDAKEPRPRAGVAARGPAAVQAHAAVLAVVQAQLRRGASQVPLSAREKQQEVPPEALEALEFPADKEEVPLEALEATADKGEVPLEALEATADKGEVPLEALEAPADKGEVNVVEALETVREAFETLRSQLERLGDWANLRGLADGSDIGAYSEPEPGKTWLFPYYSKNGVFGSMKESRLALSSRMTILRRWMKRLQPGKRYVLVSHGGVGKALLGRGRRRLDNLAVLLGRFKPATADERKGAAFFESVAEAREAWGCERLPGFQDSIADGEEDEDDEELVDVTSSFSHAKREATLKNGRSYLCCCRQDSSGTEVVCTLKDVSGPTERLMRSGCGGLAGPGYHSWNTMRKHGYAGYRNAGRCVVPARELLLPEED